MRARNVKEQPPSESSKWRRPRDAADELRDLLAVERIDARGQPDLRLKNVGLALSMVPLEDVHVSSISSQRPR